MSHDPYRKLSVGYSAHRRPDPRIAALIARALGDAATVLNVGAGAGSYEPNDRVVVAVEPSSTMLAQRLAGAAPSIQATAEALPTADHAADAALAIFTVHHWTDPAAGLAELVRVSRRQVVLTWDPHLFASSLWLVNDYLPEIGHREADLACLATVIKHLQQHQPRVEVTPIPVPTDCTDGFLGAYWSRPHAYLDPTIRAAASGLASLPAQIVDSAIDRLSHDLASGHWYQRHG